MLGKLLRLLECPIVVSVSGQTMKFSFRNIPTVCRRRTARKVDTRQSRDGQSAGRSNAQRHRDPPVTPSQLVTLTWRNPPSLLVPDFSN